MSVITDLEPRLLWKYFDAIRQIPRASGNEKQVSGYVVSVAGELGLECEQDEQLNVLIRKPGSPGHESAPTIVLQSHLDMVCEKNSDTVFDFDKDPIKLKLEGEWLKADGTTLGADNGIGIATTLAILEDDSLVHGPLEAIFTVDEETGMNGAMSLDPDWLKGRIMLNLDSEDLGLFSIGCAGGADSHASLPVKRTSPTGDQQIEIKLFGLRGGHSGVDIHEGRGNALKIINRLLFQLYKKVPYELVCYQGGDKHNAIPREAHVRMIVNKAQVPEIEAWLAKNIEYIRQEFKPVESNIQCTVTPVDGLPDVLDKASRSTLISLIFAYPHGPLAYSRSIKGLVETSNNVAAIKCDDDQVKIHLSSRSSNDHALQATLDKLVSISELAAAAIDQPPGYPGWQPNVDSPLLKVTMDTYKEVTGQEARYEAIHAGLECGLVGEKYPGMDMISIGPDIKHPHSPDECVHVGTVDVFYKHTVKILEKLA